MVVDLFSSFMSSHSEIVPSWGHFFSGCSMRTVWTSPKEWFPMPTEARSMEGAPSIMLPVVLICSKWILSNLFVAKLTGQSLIYTLVSSHWPPIGHRNCSRWRSPSVFSTCRVISPKVEKPINQTDFPFTGDSQDDQPINFTHRQLCRRASLLNDVLQLCKAVQAKGDGYSVCCTTNAPV